MNPPLSDDDVEAPKEDNDDVAGFWKVHKLKKRLWVSATKTVVKILQTLEPSKVKNTKPLEERTNVEELVKKVLEEVGEDLHHKELVENLTEEDEEAVPLLWGYGSSYEGMLSPFPRITQK